MKYVVRIACALFVVCLLTAKADVISFSSNSTLADPNQFNSFGNNVLISPHPAWNPNGMGLWISYADTGLPGTVSPADVPTPVTGPNANPPTAIFYHNFFLPYMLNTGSLSVWADDTARVYLDSVLLIDANPVQGAACSNGPVSCTTVNGAHLDIGALNLTGGEHQLRFDVYQRSGGPFGLQYTGSVESTPEPASFVLLGAGLVALFIRFRRKQA